jgi:hypothetical protein
MGMNMILTLIVGIVMSTIIASKVAPSIIENIKIKKVENITITNQDTIKEAIYRYIRIHKILPNNMNDLINKGILTSDINDNGFGVEHIIDSEKYTWVIGSNGTLKISTTIEDNQAGKYFTNNFNNKVKPKNTSDNNYETFYLIPDDIFKIYHIPLP